MGLIPNQIKKGADTAYTILFLLVIVGVIFMVWKITQNLKSGDASKIKDAVKIADKQGEGAYYNDADLMGFADSIYMALEHGDWFSNLTQDDNEAAVISIMLNLQTSGDAYKLSQFYTQKYASPLNAVLISELNMEDIQRIREDFKSKGIKYTL